MMIRHIVHFGFGLMVLVVIGLPAKPAWPAEPLAKETAISVKRIDFDECESVDIRAKIMDVRPDRGTLVVAEREIRDMDVEEGGRRIKTTYQSIDGKPESRTAFREGQYVRVKGVLHPDGYVAAFSVQKIEKPVEKKMKYKPVAASQKASRKASASAAAR
jgi:hypothetical protein